MKMTTSERLPVKVVVSGLICVLALLGSFAASAFQLQSLSAERVNLTDYLAGGQWNLVMFWSTDCIPCEQQKPMIEAFHQAHQKQDAVVLGVALDGMENIDQIDVLIEKHNPSYPNLVVFTDVFHRQFREMTGHDFRATPTYLLFTPEGELAGTRVGPIEREMIEEIIATKNQ